MVGGVIAYVAHLLKFIGSGFRRIFYGMEFLVFSSGSIMKAISIQYFLGAIFLILGSWALFFPGHVERLVLSPDYYIGSVSSSVLVGCFGAQAVLCSVLIFFSTFTSRTFIVFGLVGSIPFFGFNYYFVFVEPVFNTLLAIDLIGNIGILACGILGWWLKRREEAT